MTKVCAHIRDQHADWTYAKAFSGIGTEYALVCLKCRETSEAIEANLQPVAAELFAEIESEGMWDCGRNAILNRPEVLSRTSNLSFQHEEHHSAVVLPGVVEDLKPVMASLNGECLVLMEGGDLFRVDPILGDIQSLLNVTRTCPTLTSPRSLIVSPEGNITAVVERRGQHGVILDLETGRITMMLDRGNHHPEQTDYPLAFFAADGQLRVIHGTDWNRLDISDPRTGAMMTDRSPTSYQQGEKRPEQDLNYFHGNLEVSPGGERVADNGWVWHPVGVVVAWNLRRWLETNPWESEDGPSKRDICERSYFWNGPLCWINDRELAVWGYGNDVDNLIPAALIFDSDSGKLKRWFAGPQGSFTFDGYLFSYAAESGISVWDVITGERLLQDNTFCPTCYHHGAHGFITIMANGCFRLSRLSDKGVQNKTAAV